MNRRGFLQTSMTLGAAWSISSANEQIQAITPSAVSLNHVESKENISVSTHRVLGSGENALEVSALGLGLMGMTYNRSQHPDKYPSDTSSCRSWSHSF